MKQSHCQQIVEFFKSKNGAATLSELLEAGYGSWAHSLTRRLSDLRSKGYTITCTKGKTPSQNVYEIYSSNMVNELESYCDPSWKPREITDDAPHSFERPDYGDLFKFK